MQLTGDIANIVGLVVILAVSIIAIYVVFRLVFLKEPPKSKPSQERYGKTLE